MSASSSESPARQRPAADPGTTSAAAADLGHGRQYRIDLAPLHRHPPTRAARRQSADSATQPPAARAVDDAVGEQVARGAQVSAEGAAAGAQVRLASASGAHTGQPLMDRRGPAPGRGTPSTSSPRRWRRSHTRGGRPGSWTWPAVPACGWSWGRQWPAPAARAGSRPRSRSGTTASPPGTPRRTEPRSLCPGPCLEAAAE